MKVSRLICAVMLVCMVLALGVSSSLAAAPSDTPESIKVAAFTALSGPVAAGINAYQRQWVDLVAEHYKEMGGVKAFGGAPIEIVWFDNMSDIDQMKTVVDSALQDEQFAFAIIVDKSDAVYSSLAAVTKSKVPTLVTAQADAIYQQGCDYIFGVNQLSAAAAGLTLEFVQWLASEYELNTQKIGIVAVDTEYGKTQAEAFRSKVTGLDGYEVAYYSLYPQASNDLSSVVTALKANGVEILYHSGHEQDSKLLYNSMQMLDFNPLVIGGGSGLLYPTYAEALGDNVVGLISNSMGCSYLKQGMADSDFYSLIQKSYKQLGNAGADFLLDYNLMFQIITDTLNESGTLDRETNKNTMKSMKYEVIFPLIDDKGEPTNILYFDKNGISPNASTTVVQYKNTEFGNTPVVVYPAAFAASELQFGTGIK